MGWIISLLRAIHTYCCDNATEDERPFRVVRMKDTSKSLKSLSVEYFPR